MKKIVYFIFITSMAFFSVLNFFDYSNEISEKIESNKVTIEIEKPKDLTNDKFVDELISLFHNMNTDIIYKTIDNTKIKSNHQYYITNNTDDSLNLNIKNKNEIPNEYGMLSTINDNSAKDSSIIGSSFFYNVSIYNFKEVQKFNLNSCQYYVDKNMKDTITENLISHGYLVNVINGTDLTKKYVSFSSMFLPAFLLFISILFYTISRRKEILCKQLLGYSRTNIICDDCINTIQKLILLTFIIQTLNFGLVELIYNNSFCNYLCFTYNKLIGILLYTIIILVISNIVNLGKKRIGYLKGKNKNFDIYLITLVTKIIFVMLLTAEIASISTQLISIYSINKINMNISKKIENFVALPVNTSTTYVGESNQMGYNKKLNEFYNETVNKFNGVLIDTRNYRTLNTENNPAKTVKQNDITINENYLKLNPIHDINNNIINENSITKEKFNILIPQSSDENQIENLYSKRYKLNADDINIIKYLNGENINSFNPYSGQESNGLINDPVILIYNERFLSNKMLNYISGQYYFLETSTSTPYNEIKPFLDKYGLDSIILESPYISNVFSASVSRIKTQLTNDVITFIIYIIGTIIMIIYNSKIYFAIYSEEIAYKRINGYKFMETYKIPLIIQGIQIILLLLLRTFLNYRNFLNINLLIILLVALTELVIFTIYLKRYELKSILAILKGEN
jgi:hypothetical protein